MIASLLRLSRTDLVHLCRADYKARNIDAYGIHRVVYSLFPKIAGGRDFLFVDKGGDFHERRVLILSKRPPLSPDHGSVTSKEVPASFLAFDGYGFAVRLNPTKRDKQSGKIVPVGSGNIPIEKKMALRDWFCNKTVTWGIQIDEERLQVQYSLQAFDKSERTVTQSAAVFNGILRVSDRALFIKSFEDGIGRGKSFGFGLLELIPLREK